MSQCKKWMDDELNFVTFLLKTHSALKISLCIFRVLLFILSVGYLCSFLECLFLVWPNNYWRLRIAKSRSKFSEPRSEGKTILTSAIYDLYRHSRGTWDCHRFVFAITCVHLMLRQLKLGVTNLIVHIRSWLSPEKATLICVTCVIIDLIKIHPKPVKKNKTPTQVNVRSTIKSDYCYCYYNNYY